MRVAGQEYRNPQQYRSHHWKNRWVEKKCYIIVMLQAVFYRLSLILWAISNSLWTVFLYLMSLQNVCTSNTNWYKISRKVLVMKHCLVKTLKNTNMNFLVRFSNCMASQLHIVLICSRVLYMMHPWLVDYCGSKCLARLQNKVKWEGIEASNNL